MTKQTGNKPTPSTYWKTVAVEAAQDTFQTKPGLVGVLIVMVCALLYGFHINSEKVLTAGEWAIVLVSPLTFLYTSLAAGVIHDRKVYGY